MKSSLYLKFHAYFSHEHKHRKIFLYNNQFLSQVKDPNHGKLRNIPAPGLGSDGKKRSGPASSDDKKFTQSDYVVPPKVPQLQVGAALSASRQREDDAAKKKREGEVATTFDLPKEIADPTKSPCVNVPDW